jgi:hypothetical protein
MRVDLIAIGIEGRSGLAIPAGGLELALAAVRLLGELV